MMKRKYLAILLIIFLIIFKGTVFGFPQFVLIYVVQEGDTLYDIAREYRISLNNLIAVNDLPDNVVNLRPGHELVIPLPTKEYVDNEQENPVSLNWGNQKIVSNFQLDVSGKYAVRVNQNQIIPEIDFADDQIIKYHVNRGDSLYELARNFNTSIGVIMALNELDSHIIRKGETIKLPINNLTPRQVIARTITDDDLDILARAIHGEARGEAFIGQVAVGAVIINRLLDYHFPDTFRGVIYQPGQFCVVADGQINLPPNQTSFEAAREALRGVDPTQGALYYYNPRTATNATWIKTNRRTVVTIGEHVFAR